MLKQRFKRRLFSLLCRVIQSPRILIFRLLSNNCTQGKPICYRRTLKTSSITGGSSVINEKAKNAK